MLTVSPLPAIHLPNEPVTHTPKAKGSPMAVASTNSVIADACAVTVRSLVSA